MLLGWHARIGTSSASLRKAALFLRSNLKIFTSIHNTHEDPEAWTFYLPLWSPKLGFLKVYSNDQEILGGFFLGMI